jgi:hypothetical protein
MATKKIELLKPFGLHVKGAILSPDAPVADLLIARGAAIAIAGVELTQGEPEGVSLTRRQAKLQAHGRKPDAR